MLVVQFLAYPDYNGDNTPDPLRRLLGLPEALTMPTSRKLEHGLNPCSEISRRNIIGTSESRNPTSSHGTSLVNELRDSHRPMENLVHAPHIYSAQATDGTHR